MFTCRGVSLLLLAAAALAFCIIGMTACLFMDLGGILEVGAFEAWDTKFSSLAGKFAHRRMSYQAQ